MSELVIGRRGDDHVEIRVMRRSHPHADDYWDGNWVDCEIRVNISPWHAAYSAQLRTDEFSRFADEVRELYETRGQASFQPMEPWLRLTLERDALGHITIRGDAGPGGFGRDLGQVRLTFHLNGVMDQTDLPPLIADLAAIARDYPTKGSASD